MAFKIVRNDITKVVADIIVNTANPKPKCVSGTDLAIYEAAGKEALLAERRLLVLLKEERLQLLELIISTLNILFIQ